MGTTRDSEATVGMHRRQLLALGAAMVAGRALAACGPKDGAAGLDGGTTGAGEAGVDGAAAANDAGTCLANEVDAGASTWATGGTASMTARATYPNPFASGCNLPTACAATCELTQGPCYSDQSVEIQDISYGYGGLPTRFYFQVLDESCKPVSGAVIDVWHVSPVGKYSGDDSTNEDIAFCTDNDSDFTSHLYFRGKQTTDANGVAYFDSCFPGWYSSRTVHVHLTISVGGSAYVTTQLCFDDALVDAIVAGQPLYDTRGQRDTTNTTDTVFTASDYGDYEMAVARMSDGAMLAWKTIVVRSSLSESVCGGSGDGGSGGAPGGGGMSGEGGPGAPPEGGMGGPRGEGGAP
jgi:protocatechuate 3,4-dioxygenase beta subunit